MDNATKVISVIVLLVALLGAAYAWHLHQEINQPEREALTFVNIKNNANTYPQGASPFSVGRINSNDQLECLKHSPAGYELESETTNYCVYIVKK